jgi:hypothetical protein
LFSIESLVSRVEESLGFFFGLHVLCWSNLHLMEEFHEIFLIFNDIICSIIVTFQPEVQLHKILTVKKYRRMKYIVTLEEFVKRHQCLSSYEAIRIQFKILQAMTSLLGTWQWIFQAFTLRTCEFFGFLVHKRHSNVATSFAIY